jgi:chaperonin cofactor prefoldin
MKHLKYIKGKIMESRHDRFDEVNPNDFTQKDLMLHLLQVAQHSATREDVKEDIGKLDIKFDKLESKLDIKFDKLESKLDIKFDKLESKLDIKFDKLESKIDRVDNKFNRLQWLIVATIISVFLKDSLFSLLAQ